MPATRDIDIYRGDTAFHTVTIKDANGAVVNVSARTFASQLRRYPDADTIAATFTVDMANAATGVVVFSLPPATTAGLEPGPYSYDVQQTASGVVTTLLAGKATVSADVTRAAP